jgi:hypothetical protein
MTRKHYETIAISLGSSLRDTFKESAAWYTVICVVKTLADDLRATNPRFDRDRFVEFVLDVAEYRRDLDGKKIKGAA